MEKTMDKLAEIINNDRIKPENANIMLDPIVKNIEDKSKKISINYLEEIEKYKQLNTGKFEPVSANDIKAFMRNENRDFMPKNDIPSIPEFNPENTKLDDYIKEVRETMKEPNQIDQQIQEYVNEGQIQIQNQEQSQQEQAVQEQQTQQQVNSQYNQISETDLNEESGNTVHLFDDDDNIEIDR